MILFSFSIFHPPRKPSTFISVFFLKFHFGWLNKNVSHEMPSNFGKRVVLRILDRTVT